MAKKYTKVGTVRVGDYGYYMVLDKGVKLTKDGQELEFKGITLQDPRKFLDFLEENEHITEKEATKRREKLKELDWLKYELIIKSE